MSRTKRVVCLQKEAVWWETGQGKDGYQLRFLISLRRGGCLHPNGDWLRTWALAACIGRV